MTEKTFETGWKNDGDPEVEIEVDEDNDIYLNCGNGLDSSNDIAFTMDAWDKVTAWVDEQRGIARGATVEVATAPYTARIGSLERALELIRDGHPVVGNTMTFCEEVLDGDTPWKDDPSCAS